MIRLGEVVIVGGGCYGSFYAGQLAKAREKGSVTWRRLLIVDRDPHCAATALTQAISDTEVVVADWSAFFDQWLDPVERAADDQIVPSPLMPHLMADWIERRAVRAWPEATVSRVPAESPMGTPFDRLHPVDGVRYVSFADWLCPTHCIEPAICPATRAPRSWEMADTVTTWAADRKAALPTAPAALFPCRHMVHGVGMYPASRAFAAFDALAAQLAETPMGADLVVGSVSSCHGAVGVLRVSRD